MIYKTNFEEKNEQREKAAHLKNLAIKKVKKNYDRERKLYSKSRHYEDFAKRHLKSRKRFEESEKALAFRL
jgi:hypothetical protein